MEAQGMRNGHAKENAEKGGGGGGGGGVIMNSTSLEDVVLSEHSDNRAQSVQSLHTDEDDYTPTPTPMPKSPTLDEELTDDNLEELRKSEEKIRRMRKEHAFLMELTETFKTKMDSITKSMDIAKLNKPTSDSGDIMSLMMAKERTKKLNDAYKNLSEFMKLQEEVEQKLDSNSSLLPEQNEICQNSSNNGGEHDVGTLHSFLLPEQNGICQNSSNNGGEHDVGTLHAKQPEMKNDSQGGNVEISKSAIRNVPILRKGPVKSPVNEKAPKHTPIDSTDMNDMLSKLRHLGVLTLPKRPYLNNAYIHKRLDTMAADAQNQAYSMEQTRLQLELLKQEIIARQNEIAEAMRYSSDALLRNSVTRTSSPARPEIMATDDPVEKGPVPAPRTRKIIRQESETQTDPKDFADKDAQSETTQLIRDCDENTAKYKQILRKLESLAATAKNAAIPTAKHLNSDKSFDSESNIEEIRNRNDYSVPEMRPEVTGSHKTTTSSTIPARDVALNYARRASIASPPEVTPVCATATTTFSEGSEPKPKCICKCTCSASSYGRNKNIGLEERNEYINESMPMNETLLSNDFSSNMDGLLTCQGQNLLWQLKRDLDTAKNNLQNINYKDGDQLSLLPEDSASNPVIIKAQIQNVFIPGDPQYIKSLNFQLARPIYYYYQVPLQFPTVMYPPQPQNAYVPSQLQNMQYQNSDVSYNQNADIINYQQYQSTEQQNSDVPQQPIAELPHYRNAFVGNYRNTNADVPHYQNIEVEKLRNLVEPTLCHKEMSTVNDVNHGLKEKSNSLPFNRNYLLKHLDPQKSLLDDNNTNLQKQPAKHNEYLNAQKNAMNNGIYQMPYIYNLIPKYGPQLAQGAQPPPPPQGAQVPPPPPPPPPPHPSATNVQQQIQSSHLHHGTPPTYMVHYPNNIYQNNSNVGLQSVQYPSNFQHQPQQPQQPQYHQQQEYQASPLIINNSPNNQPYPQQQQQQYYPQQRLQHTTVVNNQIPPVINYASNHQENVRR